MLIIWDGIHTLILLLGVWNILRLKITYRIDKENERKGWMKWISKN